MSIILRFVTCHDAISAGIRLGEYGFWASHVEAVMPDGTFLGAHAAGGVQARAADYDRGEWTKQLFVHIPTTDEQAAAFHEFLRAQLGKSYDLTAIEALVAQRDWREPDSWFCSELQTAALESAGLLLELAADVWKITPRDLLLVLSGALTVGQPELAA